MQVDPLDEQLAASIYGDLERAWDISERLARERPRDDRAAFNRGWHLLYRGDFKAGMRETERGRRAGVFGSPPLTTRKPRWSGAEDLRGKTVLLRGEGGFGDEIAGARFAKTLTERGARVVASASFGIVSLFARAQGVAQAIAHGQEDRVLFDYWLPAMSAPLTLDIDYDTIPDEPYLSAESVYVEKWKALLRSHDESFEGQRTPTLRVGVRWSGNPKFEHEQHRSFPVEPLLALADIPGVKLYSLQRDHDLRDLPKNIVDLQHPIETWEDTAAAISNLDVVISSCTAVAHLAAAMGKETWIIIPVLPYYFWALPGERSPWYKSVRLFRQEKFGEWDAPLSKVRSELEKKTAMHEEKNYTPPPTLAPHQVGAGPAPKPPFASASSRAEALQRLAVAGLYIAPPPSPKTTGGQGARKLAEKNTLHFVGGLPRSGSTALVSLLAQNPRVYSAPISGLAGMFSGVHFNWDKSDFHRELPNPDAKQRILSALLAYYHETERPITLDKDRQWMALFEQLEEVLERPVKMLLPVRPLPEILASFEVLYRKNPLTVTGSEEALGLNSTIETRAAYFASANGPVGLAYNVMKDAVTKGYLDRILFVDYSKLMSAPKAQLKRIYEFLEEPYFEHDFNHVEQIAKGDWRPHKLPGLHDVRPEFKKDYKPARQILGADIYALYDKQEPWLPWT